ncbi:MAG: SDR family oxidoreductase [Candidatus Brocadiia bacterium]|nr:SDR family oxidoreductase [Candidatus Brocadiia bacterium]
MIEARPRMGSPSEAETGAILAGKVAVVTGGASDIGGAIAKAFANQGCRLVLAGRRRVPLEEVAHEVEGLAVPCDVSVEADVVGLMRACDEAYGRLDVLVNNAGTSGAFVNAEDMDVAAWDTTFAVNLRGVALCIKHGIPLLKRQGGSIVNMSSLIGLKGYPMRSDYAASRFAVIGVTQSVAQELGPLGIRVNALCPGAVVGQRMRTTLAERARKEGRTQEDIIKSDYTDTAALRKWVTPDDVAAAALFLASDAASATTGEALRVDAGRA